MKVTKEDIKVILWATIEDYLALWEVPWELKNIHGNSNESKLKILALKIIKFFLQNELIELYCCVEPFGEISKIDGDINFYYNLLNQDKYWNIPDNGDKTIRIGATEKGEKLYRESNYEDYIE